ncbi:MAG: 23S rRNA (uracil(1939)-C(5))-methyltransferase RlmD [Eubacterium sp.]|nr:23S rRNA (uracil(1939)-C(5))-methyltransferase RlmD [Eubacterium sp.]
MYQKNDELTVTIEDQGTNGEGIGKVNGYALFVKDTVIGDECKVKIMKAKKNFAFAKLIEIISPSEYRVEEKCPVAKQCGGCQLQSMSYDKQLEFKANKVFNNFKRIGGFDTCQINMKPIIGMDEPYYYRNKAQFPVGKNKDGEISYGFFAGRTHSIIETPGCVLGMRIDGRDICKEIMDTVISFMKDNDIEPYDEQTQSGYVRHVLIRISEATKQVMVCVVTNSDELPVAEKLVDDLKEISNMTSISINTNKEFGNVIMGKRTVHLFGPGYIEDYIGDIKFRISPESFFQVNSKQVKKLYDKALEYANLTGEEVVWDMYCGIGTITLSMANKAKKVYGVEIVRNAIEDARNNAIINNIDSAEFIQGAAEEVVPKYFSENDGEECHPDVIVVDPPRKGCDQKLLQTMVEMNPERIVYVSCDSATLARDVAWLKENGYKLNEVTPVDMFPQTVHVESVVLLTLED